MIKQILDKHVYPKLGEYTAEEIDPSLIRDVVLRPMWDEGQSGEKVFECLKQGFSWMERINPKFISPLRSTNKKDIGIIQNKSKKTTLTMDEIVQFWNFLDYGENIMRPETKYALKLMIVTGQRTKDVLEAPWDEFDFGKKMWVISADRYKSGHITMEPHYVPLSDLAVNLFKRLKDMGHPTATILLEKAPVRAVNRIQDRLPFEKKFTPHDLRRTFSTRMVEDFRFNELLIDMVIGHVQPGMHKIYQTGERLDERREALDFWAAKLRELIEASSRY